MRVMALDHLLLIVLVGLVAGFMATHLVAGHGFGLAGDIIVGILGALLAYLFLGSFLVAHVLTPLEIPSTSVLGQIVIAFIGSAILLLIIRLVTRAGWGSGSYPRRRRLL